MLRGGNGSRRHKEQYSLTVQHLTTNNTISRTVFIYNMLINFEDDLSSIPPFDKLNNLLRTSKGRYKLTFG